MIPAGAAALDMLEYTEPRGGEGVVKHTLCVTVEDKPGALTRITTMFARRGFNIESLAVGPTERPGVSCITLRVDCTQHSLEQIEKQIHKLVNVLRVTELVAGEAVERELLARAGDGGAGAARRARHDGRGPRRAAPRRRPGLRRARADRAHPRSSTRSTSSAGRTASSTSSAPGASASRARPRSARRRGAWPQSRCETSLAPAPFTDRKGPERWPRSSVTATSPSSTARSPSSATAARATPTH